MQIRPFLATSYQITGTSTGDFWGTNTDAWTSHALFVEIMRPGSMFSVGGGPSITSGTIKRGCFAILTECGPPPTSEDFFGLGFDGRLAYTFGLNRPTVRAGFTLEVAVHASQRGATGILGIGVDMF